MTIDEFDEPIVGPSPRGVLEQASLSDLSRALEILLETGDPKGEIRFSIWYNLDGHPNTFSHVTNAVRQHRGFGEWMAFKVADMGERVMGLDIDFSDCELGIYKDPRQGAAVAFLEWAAQGGPQPHKEEYGPGKPVPEAPWGYPITDEELKDTVAHFVKQFRHFKAPPRGDRPVNVQEVETIFCKYKSHLKGHYPPGKDILEIGHGLAACATNPLLKSDLSQELLRHLPTWPPKSR